MILAKYNKFAICNACRTFRPLAITYDTALFDDFVLFSAASSPHSKNREFVEVSFKCASGTLTNCSSGF